MCNDHVPFSLQGHRKTERKEPAVWKILVMQEVSQRLEVASFI